MRLRLKHSKSSLLVLFYFISHPFHSHCIVCFSISCSFTLLIPSHPTSHTLQYNAIDEKKRNKERKYKAIRQLKLNLQLLYWCLFSFFLNWVPFILPTFLCLSFHYWSNFLISFYTHCQSFLFSFYFIY